MTASRLPAFPVNSAPIVSVCMFCHRIIGRDQLPAGKYIPTGALVSHGVCLPCTPAYFADLGLSAADTARVIAANTPIDTPLQRGASANQKPETVSTVSQ